MNATMPDPLSDSARAWLNRDSFHHLLGDSWTESEDGRTFTTEDPATGETIATVALAGEAEVEKAVAAARAALPAWSATAPADRGLLLHRLADQLEANAEQLAEIESLDNGKPVKIARVVDVRLAIAHLRSFAGWPERIWGEVLPVGYPNMLVTTRHEPVGVCAQIVPWNMPLLMAVWKIAPALAAGCTTVLKPASPTPLSAARLAELTLEAGVPTGVLNLLCGTREAGAKLVSHPGVDKVSFTGSTEVGRSIAAEAGAALKRVTLELGGKSPNVFLADADVDAAVKGSFQGMYFNSGQACNAGSRLFVPRDSFDDVVSRLAERAGKAVVGPGLDPATQFGPLISASQRDRVQGYIEAGKEAGAELLAGGEGSGHERGWFVEPTLFATTDDEISIAREEIFGPVLVASPYDSLEEIAERANSTEYGLAAGIWTRDLGAAQKLAAQLRAGSVYVNCWGFADPLAPFGGFKASGIGREHGREGLDAYLETKTVWSALG
jgi:aldehyde dehydrogenase (NAD+)